MKVLFVIPPLPKIVDKKALGSKWPRIGIAYIAGFLREYGITVGILDCKTEKLNIEQAIIKILAFNPDIIGITSFTEEIIETAGLCKAVKKINRNIITIVGGAHASAIPEQMLNEFKDIDIAVYGEGEITLLEIVQLKKFDLINVKGIVYRKNGRIIRNKPRELIKDIDSLPYPAWDLFPLEQYRGRTILSLGEKKHENILELPILSTRGCPYRCNFCFHVYGHTARFRDYKKIVDEIEFNINTYNSTQFFFADGTFGIRKNNVIKLCNEIIKRKLNKKIKWTAPTRADVVTEETLRLMKKAGCLTFAIGVESGDEQILKNSGKNETKEQIRKSVTMAKKVGLPIETSIILGHPNETSESIKNSLDFAKELDIDSHSIPIMIPYPGTKIMQMAEKGEGNYRLLSKDWSKYMKQTGGPLELKNISLNQLRMIQARAYLRYYSQFKKIPYIIKMIPLRKIIIIFINLLKNVASSKK